MHLRDLPAGTTVYYGENGQHTFSIHDLTHLERDLRASGPWSIRWSMHDFSTQVPDFEGHPTGGRVVTLDTPLGGVFHPPHGEVAKEVIQAAGVGEVSGAIDPVGEAKALFEELIARQNLAEEREIFLRTRILESQELADILREKLVGTDLSATLYDRLHKILKPEGQGELVIKPEGTRVLIANRGEIAIRVLNWIQRENNDRPADKRLVPIVMYAPWDKDSLHVRRAKGMGGEAYLIEAEPGMHEAKAYTHVGRIVEIARESGADFVHPGYGYLSESPELSEAVRSAGVAFMGPPPEAARLAESKDEFKKICEANDIPVTKGTKHGTEDLDELIKQLLETGLAVERNGKVGLKYVLRLKAVAAGGGRGQATVHTMEELKAVFGKVVQEGRVGFGRGDVMAEMYVKRFVHIEEQILADRFGNIVALGERECTLQERAQKLLEFSDSPLFYHYDSLRESIRAAAAKVTKALGYVGVGTVEFMVDPDTGEFYAMELNARIQVEHVVTEMVSGVDIVNEQARIAQGRPLSLCQDQVTINGMAVEIRLKAVNPDKRTKEGTPLPTSGPVTRFSVLGRDTLEGLYALRSEGVRVETAIETSGGPDRISQYGDAMFAKIVVHIPTRDRRALLQKVQRVLAATIMERPQNIPTDLDRQRALVATKAVESGWYDNHMVGHWEEAKRREDLTLFPFQEEQTSSLPGGGLLRIRMVSRQPLGKASPKNILEPLQGAFEKKAANLENAPLINLIIGQPALQALFKNEQAYDHSLVIDAEGNLISWTVLDREHVPYLILMPIHERIDAMTSEGHVTAKGILLALHPKRENGSISAWEVDPWLIRDHVLPLIMSSDGRRSVGPQEGKTIIKLTLKNQFIVELINGQQGHHTIFAKLQIRDKSGNLLYKFLPEEFIASPHRRLPYMLAAVDPSVTQIPSAIKGVLRTLHALSHDEKEAVFREIAGIPEGLEEALWHLLKISRRENDSEKNILGLVLSEILLRRSLFGLRILGVVRDEVREAVGIRFRYYDRASHSYRTKGLVRMVQDVEGGEGVDSANAFVIGRAVHHAAVLLEKVSAGSDAIIELALFRTSGDPLPLDHAWLNSILSESPDVKGVGRISIFDDMGHEVINPPTSYRRGGDDNRFVIDRDWIGMFPATAASHQLWRWTHNFGVMVLPGSKPHNMVVVTKAKDPLLRDRRLVGFGLLQGVKIQRSHPTGPIESIPAADQAFSTLLASMAEAREEMPADERPAWNRVVMRAVAPMEATADEATDYILKLCERHETTLEFLNLEKGIVILKVQDSRSPHGLRHVMLSIRHAVKKYVASRLNGIHAQVATTSGVVSKRVWVDDEVYEQWVADPVIVLQDSDYILDRPVQAMHPEEMLMAQMKAKGLVHWRELAQKFTALLPGGAYETWEYVDFKRNPKTGLIDPDTGKLQKTGSSASSHLGPKEKNGFDIILLHRRESDQLVPDSLLVVGNPVANFGQLTPIEQGTKNAALRLASQLGIPVIICANNISGAGIDSPIFQIDESEGRVSVEFPVTSAAPNLDAIASTMRDINLVAQKLGVPIIGILNGLNIGGQAYEHSQASMQPETAGIILMLPQGSASLTGTRLWAIAQTPGIRTTDISVTARKRFPDGERSLAGIGVLGPNQEVTFLPRSLNEAVAVAHQWLELTRRDFVADQLSVVDKVSVSLSGSSEKQALIALLANYQSTRDQKAVWPKLLLDGGASSIPSLFQGAKLNTQVMVGRIAGEPTMLIVSPAIFTTEDSRMVARAIRKASLNRMPLMIVGTYAGFMADPKAMGDRQLEHGADIAKALTEYRGPGVLVYIHGVMAGGNYVVFAESINPGLVTLTASPTSQIVVVGGRPAVQAVYAGKVSKLMERLAKDQALLAKVAQSLGVFVKDEGIDEAEFLERVRSAIEIQVAQRLDASTSARVAYEQGHLSQIIELQDLREAAVWYQHGRRLDWDRQRDQFHNRELVIASLKRWGVSFSLASGGWAIEVPDGGKALDFKTVLEIIDSISYPARNAWVIGTKLRSRSDQ